MSSRTFSGSVAITGASQRFGIKLVQELLKFGNFSSIVCIDATPCPVKAPTVSAEILDLTDLDTTQNLVNIFDKHKVNTVIHLAYLNMPIHQADWAHELESAGTQYVLNAISECEVQHLITKSTTMVYGAKPNMFIQHQENEELSPFHNQPFLREKASAEKQIMVFSQSHPKICVTTLRFAGILGPNLRTFWCSFWRQRYMPFVIGRDPLMQFVHLDDAIHAIILALIKREPGVFNIAGSKISLYSTLLKVANKIPVPMPSFLVEPIFTVTWMLQVSRISPGLLNFFKYPCIADTQRAENILGFQPKLSTVESLYNYLYSS